MLFSKYMKAAERRRKDSLAKLTINDNLTKQCNQQKYYPDLLANREKKKKYNLIQVRPLLRPTHFAANWPEG